MAANKDIDELVELVVAVKAVDELDKAADETGTTEANEADADKEADLMLLDNGILTPSQNIVQFLQKWRDILEWWYPTISLELTIEAHAFGFSLKKVWAACARSKIRLLQWGNSIFCICIDEHNVQLVLFEK